MIDDLNSTVTTMNQVAFIEKLNKIMAIRDLKQIELSVLSGIPQSSLSLIMNGKRKPDIDTIITICNSLDVSLDELFAADINNRRPSMSEEEILLKTYSIADVRDRKAIRLILNKYDDRIEVQK